MPIFANSWLILFAAIALEVCGTYAIKLSDGFTRLVPSLCVLVFYCCSFTCMSIAVRKIDLGVAYAIWSGVGIVATTTIGVVLLNEIMTLRKVFSIALILFGVVLLKLSPSN
ncbi:MAG: DMT family transporter [Halodesulfovibrio sp.]